MTKLVQVGRLALRREGKWWNAYYATTDSMEGAELLGSIRMSIVEENGNAKDAFMNAMREAIADILERVTGTRPIWKEPQPAPEHERAGLCIIPAVPTEQEIERIENAIIACNPGHGEVVSILERKARAAASAVREQDEQRGKDG